MSYRFMRMIVFFDLPTESANDRKQYRLFRKALIRNGFLMLQESVYCKLLLTPSSQESAVEALKRAQPSSGIIQILTITEKQFSKMEYLVGEYKSDVITTDERIVFL